MTQVRFTKMQGAGNDFVVLDATRAPFTLSPAQLQRLADRRLGVGCDQILVVEPAPAPDVDFGYRIFNADASEVEHCGNGARCFVRYVLERGLIDRPQVRVQTVNRRLLLEAQPDGRVRVDMGTPRFLPADCAFDSQGLPERETGGGTQWAIDTPQGTHWLAVASMGNPHAVLRVADIACAPVAALGPEITSHARFAQGVNTGFMQVLARDRVALRVHERGAGETLACGTGACAAAALGMRMGWLDPAVEVQMPGGDLRIEWAGGDAALFMTGPATTVFEGEITL